MSNFLDKLRPQVLKRVEGIKPSTTNDSGAAGIDFLDIFKQRRPAFIAEIKFASPSEGNIYEGTLDPVSIAGSYLKNGASALSVLTEPHYFKGDIQYIKDIRNAYPDCSILLKDFLLDEKQIIQGKEYGANAVLLIAAFLKPDQLKRLYDFALSLELTPLIEINNSSELESILPLNPKLIGVNNRDLKSMKIDLDISRSLIKEIPESTYTICASGIFNGAQVQEMLKLGFDGFLVGSSLMEASDPGVALREILNQITE